MKITFIGATHEVTGSCALVEAGGQRLLVDCGMEQGEDTFENQELPVNPGDIDFVLLTHAHIDHSGNLPLLYKNGFRGQVYATRATCDLANIMLRDCAHIQMTEAEWKNRKAKRAGAEVVNALYDINDVEGLIAKLRPCSYDEAVQVGEGIDVCFRHVGHLLGAASIEVTLTENGVTKKLVFSGDIGNRYQPIICDDKNTTDADYIIVESTYGDRLHEGKADGADALAGFIQRTFDRGGNVVIPSFAVGRTQEILYYIRRIKDERMVTGHGDFPVYMDSPLANEATAIFLQCDEENLDPQTRKMIDDGINPIFFSGLQTAVSSDESKAINSDPRPKVIISASGMCEAGRIRHHLKHNLWRKECLILFVGYQSVGTLGRSLVEGIPTVKLFGESIEVAAQIGVLAGISGHADRDGLTEWVASFKKKPEKVFVNHGDDASCIAFTELLSRQLGLDACAPYSGTSYDLLTGEVLDETTGLPVIKKTRRATTVYNRLSASTERLAALVRRSEGFPNKDLARLADQIDALCEKFDR